MTIHFVIAVLAVVLAVVALRNSLAAVLSRPRDAPDPRKK
jgi:hypothetical protein